MLIIKQNALDSDDDDDYGNDEEDGGEGEWCYISMLKTEIRSNRTHSLSYYTQLQQDADQHDDDDDGGHGHAQEYEDKDDRDDCDDRHRGMIPTGLTHPNSLMMMIFAFMSKFTEGAGRKTMLRQWCW